ncbi:MAG: hypothetical protein ACK4N5_05765, partial [Myxococcales bacterium]
RQDAMDKAMAEPNGTPAGPSGSSGASGASGATGDTSKMRARSTITADYRTPIHRFFRGHLDALYKKARDDAKRAHGDLDAELGDGPKRAPASKRDETFDELDADTAE